MSADRLVPTTGSGSAAWADHNVEFTKLYDVSVLPLGTIGGTADAITAQVDPALTGSLVNGMKFTITPSSPNTVSSFTLRIDGPGGSPVGTAKQFVDRDGNAIAAGNWRASRRHVIEYDSGLGKFRVLSNIEPTPTAAVAQPAFRNVLSANGGMEIWQRGAGGSASIAVLASTTAYTVDRWYLITNANQASTVFQSSGLSGRSRWCAVVQRNSGQTGTGGMIFAHPLTIDEVYRLRAAKATLQFKAQAGANFSPASGTLSYAVYVGTGSEGKRGAGFTSETTVLSGSVNLSGSITSVTATSGSSVPSNATQGEIRFTWTPAGTAGANDWFLIDDVQLEQSDSATPFEYLPFETMLEMCQRHFCKTFPYGTAPAQNAGTAGALAGVDLNGLYFQAGGSSSFAGPTTQWRFPSRMRSTPTITTYNPTAASADWRQIGTTGSNTVTVSPSPTAASDSAVMISGVGSSSATISSAIDWTSLIHARADAGL